MIRLAVEELNRLGTSRPAGEMAVLLLTAYLWMNEQVSRTAKPERTALYSTALAGLERAATNGRVTGERPVAPEDCPSAGWVSRFLGSLLRW